MHFAKISPAALRSLFTKSVVTKSVFSVAALGLLGQMGHAAEPRVMLSSAVPPSARLRSAHLLGRLEAQTALRVGLTLPLRNQDKLAELLRRQYTPGDPLYHQFLTPPDFTAQYGPTQADYDAVAAYARAQGLTIADTSPGRTLLTVAGTTDKIEAAFGVQMSRYRLPDGRVAFSNTAAPVLPRSVAVRLAGIAGLNNIARMQPHLRRKKTADLTPYAPVPIGGGGNGIGSGPLGGLSPNDIKYAYNLSTISPLYGTSAAAPAGALTGAGQNIGLFELDGYLPADLALYTSTFALPTVLTGAAAPVTNVLLGGYKGIPLSVDGQTEVTLDIDMILALAPAATGIYVYEDDQGSDTRAGDTLAPLTIFTRMANDLNPNGSKTPLLQVISCSYGSSEDMTLSNIYQGENALFQQMAAQGQSVFCATGDQGAYIDYDPLVGGLTSPGVADPASQPFVTGVGGTTLNFVKSGTTTAGAVTAGAYVGETVWSAGTPTLNPEGGGGGVSTLWVKPSYQTGFGISGVKREVPDVTLNADPDTGYSIFVNGAAEVIGGTSAAAPLWAGYAALINQQRATNGLGSVGFMNPVLYPIAAGSSYTSDLHDITTGSNLFYQAGPGYDDASGLGSFIGAPLLAALSVNVNAGTGTAILSGTVTDNSLPPVPIAGATVTAVVATTGISAGTTTTDATGAYTLSVPSGLSLKITVGTGAVSSPTTEHFSGTVVSVGALTASGTATQNFVLPAAYTYAAGLQMISTPFDFTGVGDFAAAFGLTQAQAQLSPRLIQYAPALTSYVFYPTAPADTLRLGQGYWVRFPSATYLHLAGTPASIASAFSIPLQQGWNQIGDPFPLAASLSTISVVNSAGATVGLLPASPTVVQPTLYGFSGTAYAALNPATDALNPYQGYWIFAFQKCSLSVPAPAGITPPSLPFVSQR